MRSKLSIWKSSRIALALAIGATFGRSALAQDGSWFAVATTGTWSTDTNWNGSTIANGSGFTATFASDITADTVITLDTPRTIGNLIFGDAAVATAGSWTISGANILTLDAATPTITVNALGTNKLVTVSSILAGSNGLTKSGVGTLAITGANTYSGLTSVTGGTLVLRNNNNTATTGFSVSSGATLRLGNAISLTSTQNITGAGNLAKDTAFFGDATIAGTNNNYTGTTTVEVSRLTLAAGGVINGTSSFSISNVNNAALVNNGSITTPGAFTISGGNATSGIFTNTSTGVLNSSSISLAAGSTASNSGTINNSGAFNSNGTFTSTGTLTTGAVTVGGAFTLGSASSFTNTAGSMIINSGGLVSLGNAAHLSSIAPNGITINTGGSFATFPAFPTVNSVLASGKILNTSAGAIALSGNSSENIDFTGFSALGLAASGNAIFSGTITPVGAVYRFGGSATSNLTVASALSGTNAVTKSGVSFTTLTAANTYSGTTTVTAGTLAIGNAGAINGGAVSITGGTLAIIGGGTLNASSGGVVSIGAGNLVTSSLNNIGASGSTIALTGAGVTGLQYVGAGETTNRIIGFNTATAGGVVTASGSGTLIFSNAATTTATGAFGVTFNGQGSGSFVGITQPGTTQLINFNKQGVGSWTLTGLSNLKGGNFRADGGVLNFAATATTGSGAGIAAPISRNAANGGVLTIANGASVITSTGNTNGILGGWATFGGDTWAVTNGNATPINGLATFTNDWLTATGNADILATNTSGALTVNSLRFNTAAAVTQTLSGANVITSGGILVTPAVGANTTTITGGTSLGSGTTDLIIHQNNTAGGLTITSLITGTTGVTKAGAGTLTFNAQKTYTGTTNILEGVLNLSAGGGSAGVIRGTANIATGATLRLSTGDATGFATDTTRLSVIILLGGNLDVNTTSNQTLGSAVINMTGGSITGVANSNIDFFGGASALNTLASGMTSTISGVSLSPLRQGSTTFTVAQGYTPSGIDLDIQGVLRAVSANATNAVFIKAGNGTLALSGTNTISNTATNSIRIDAGTLMVGNGGTTGNLGGNTGGFLPVANNAVLAFNRSDAAGSFANVISGTGELRQVGSGTTTLTGANSYTGVTTVSAGTLAATGTSSMAGTSGITILPGATFVGGGTNIFVGGHGIAVPNSKVITVNGGTLLFNASMDSRFGNVTLNGGTWTSNRPLTAFDALLANTTTGPATVLVTGTVPSTMNGTGGIHLQGVQNFDVADVTGSSATDLSVSLILAGPGSIGGAAGGINKLGPGTMVLGATNTYTGTTTVNGGTLAVTGSLFNNSSTHILIAAPDNSIAGNPVLIRSVGNVPNAFAGFGSKVTAASIESSTPPLSGIALQTMADILMSHGTNADVDNLSMAWRLREPAEASPSNVNAVLSDVVSITGMDNGADIFVLQMSYNDSLAVLGSLNEAAIANSGELRLGWKDGASPTSWISAIDGNVGPAGSLAVSNFQGSWSEFVTFTGVDSTNLDLYLDSYGVDTDTNTVWAVLNHNSEFAVIPEPSTLVLGGLALLGFAGVGLRRRRMSMK